MTASVGWLFGSFFSLALGAGFSANTVTVWPTFGSCPGGKSEGLKANELVGSRPASGLADNPGKPRQDAWDGRFMLPSHPFPRYRSLRDE